jgi:hypothetical protein
MQKMFLIFFTLNGQPVGNTQYIIPMEDTCRSEINMVQGMNNMYEKNMPGMVAYGSCEPVQIAGLHLPSKK